MSLNFVPVRFVPPECPPPMPDSDSGSFTGEEARKFYETVIASGTFAATETQPTKSMEIKNAQQKKLSLKKKEKQLESQKNKEIYSSKDLFKSIAINDVRKLKNILENSQIDVDCLDDWGWTPLMCAAVGTSFEVVFFLKLAGANAHLTNPQGLTPSELAKSRGFHQLSQFINQDFSKFMAQPAAIMQPGYCQDCNSETGHMPRHQKDISHLINTKKIVDQPGFTIPPSNPGYRLMVKHMGWDGSSALGVRGTTNRRKYPVKTVFKKSRKGFGCKLSEEEKAKVTHFPPLDQRAVEGRSQKGKKVMRLAKNLSKEKQSKRMEREFRNAFHAE